MFRLTVTDGGKLVRTLVFADAAQTLKDWFAEEASGYHVICQDRVGQPVTKARLRAMARRA